MKLFTKKEIKKETFLQKVQEVKTTYPTQRGNFNEVFNTRNHPLYDNRHRANTHSN